MKKEIIGLVVLSLVVLFGCGLRGEPENNNQEISQLCLDYGDDMFELGKKGCSEQPTIGTYYEVYIDGDNYSWSEICDVINEQGGFACSQN